MIQSKIFDTNSETRSLKNYVQVLADQGLLGVKQDEKVEVPNLFRQIGITDSVGHFYTQDNFEEMFGMFLKIKQNLNT